MLCPGSTLSPPRISRAVTVRSGLWPTLLGKDGLSLSQEHSVTLTKRHRGPDFERNVDMASSAGTMSESGGTNAMTA